MLTYNPDAWKNFFVYESDFVREVRELWTHGLADAALELVPSQAGGVRPDRYIQSIMWAQVVEETGIARSGWRILSGVIMICRSCQELFRNCDE